MMKAGKTKWYFSIRYKLMAFVAVLCAFLIGLVWLITVPLLEPLYHKQLKADLTRMVNQTVELIAKHGTLEYIMDGKIILNSEFEKEINALGLPLVGKCFDISNSHNLHLAGYEGLQNACALHPRKNLAFFGSSRTEYWDTDIAIALRAEAQRLGSLSTVINSGERRDSTQLVVSKSIGSYTVTVSTDLQRVGEASRVLNGQMRMVGGILLAFSILGAFFFSRWFSKPLTQLSKAAKEVSHGNYNVKVDVKGKDEIAELCEDFNIMTNEVARTSQLQRDLIANISHDLRTPLTLIKGYAETIRDLTGDIPKKRSEQLAVIVDETDRLSGLVNSVMELSRYSSGAEKPNLIKFNLSQLCEEVAYRYSDICDKNNYILELKADEECIVTADPEQLSRVLHNLISNAIHHIGEDGYIALSCKNENMFTRIEIEDHGEGISEADLPYIFEKYYRTRASAGKVGTGLGLSITKAILQNHNYKFGVNSTFGKGSKFWFLAK